MPLLPAEPDRQRTQVLRLRAFLRWLIGAAVAFTLLEALAFLVFHDAALGVSSLVAAGCVACFLLAQAQLQRGHLQRAVVILHGVILASGLLGSVLLPDLVPLLVMLPLLALVIVLPYITGRALDILVVISWLIIISIAALDEFLPPSSIAPAWFVSVLRVVSLAAASALMLVLLVQFSNRLVETLTGTERANARLLATQAQLEAQQHDLRITLQEREEAIALHSAIE
ncbi:MAG TPA: hypothetical protein VFT99_01560, partial [Roseiflexaceae bacterium]|nr:hypothetical protein [Roseiflexaceae bacterium]